MFIKLHIYDFGWNLFKISFNYNHKDHKGNNILTILSYLVHSISITRYPDSEINNQM